MNKIERDIYGLAANFMKEICIEFVSNNPNDTLLESEKNLLLEYMNNNSPQFTKKQVYSFIEFCHKDVLNSLYFIKENIGNAVNIYPKYEKDLDNAFTISQSLQNLEEEKYESAVSYLVNIKNEVSKDQNSIDSSLNIPTNVNIRFVDNSDPILLDPLFKIKNLYLKCENLYNQIIRSNFSLEIFKSFEYTRIECLSSFIIWLTSKPDLDVPSVFKKEYDQLIVQLYNLKDRMALESRERFSNLIDTLILKTRNNTDSFDSKSSYSSYPNSNDDLFSKIWRNISLYIPWYRLGSFATLKTLGVGTVIIGILALAYLAWNKFRKKNCKELPEGPIKQFCELEAYTKAINEAQNKLSNCDNSKDPELCKKEIKKIIDRWKKEKAEIIKIMGSNPELDSAKMGKKES